MNITYNSKTPENVGAGLATRPVLTHSEIKGKQHELPNRDGVLFDDLYRGNASWQMMFHLKDSELDKKKRKVRQWLSGSGILIMSDTTDSYYEVKRVTLIEDFRKSMTYGRINAQFIVYPYEFLFSGETPINISGSSSATTVENIHDMSKPLYKITGNGSGTLNVNGHLMTFTVSSSDNGLYIDTRRSIAYNNSGANKSGVITGDYDDLWLKNGNNSVQITSGFTVVIYPKWGYII